MPPHLALGTNKLAGTFGTFTATVTLIRHGVLRPGLWRSAALATLAGALLGAVSAWAVSSILLEKLIPLLVMGAALYVGLHRPHRGPLPRVDHDAARRRGVLLGSLLGFYDGCFGPGTGAFWVALLQRWLHLDVLPATAVARYMNLVSNAVSLLTFALLSMVHYPTGLGVGVSLMLGAWLGAHAAIRLGSRQLRRVFVVLVLLMSLRLAWNAWFA